MSVILFSAYRNQNAIRKYPFTDDATLTSNAQLRLPNDFLIDADIYPVATTNLLYLSRIVMSEQRLYFAEVDTDTEICYADYVAGSDSFVYETSALNRKIGVLVFGDGAPSIFQAVTDQAFYSAATALNATTCRPVQTTGVQCFVLDNGDVVSGNVIFDGESGVEVQYDPSGLTIDIVGVPAPDVDDCVTTQQRPYITQIDCTATGIFCVGSAPGQGLVLVGSEGELYGSCQILTLDDICAAKRGNTLPDSAGRLPNMNMNFRNPLAPSGCSTSTHVSTAGFTMTSLGGHFSILAPYTSGFNMFSIVPIPNAAAGASLSLEGVAIEDLQKTITNSLSPAKPSGSVKIGIRGISDV